MLAKVLRETQKKVFVVSSENQETWWWNEEVQEKVQSMLRKSGSGR